MAAGPVVAAVKKRKKARTTEMSAVPRCRQHNNIIAGG
jgi:hypothetical protein